jgi:hypothetical protein
LDALEEGKLRGNRSGSQHGEHRMKMGDGVGEVRRERIRRRRRRRRRRSRKEAHGLQVICCRMQNEFKSEVR